MSSSTETSLGTNEPNISDVINDHEVEVLGDVSSTVLNSIEAINDTAVEPYGGSLPEITKKSNEFDWRPRGKSTQSTATAGNPPAPKPKPKPKPKPGQKTESKDDGESQG